MTNKRIVVKIGSNLLAEDFSIIKWLAAGSKKLVGEGYCPVIVSSGAIAAGKLTKGIFKNTSALSLNEKQALAAIGQPILMRNYTEEFSKLGLVVAQVLVTKGDFMSRSRFTSVRATLLALMEYGAIPVINENDTVATDEIKFGDNDELSAIVAAKIGAEKLALLTDVDGLYRGEFKKENLIRVVEKITPDIRKLASGKGRAAGIPKISQHGSGGMISKIRAAEIATAAGVTTIITRPRENFFSAIISDRDEDIEGTVFLPTQRTRALFEKTLSKNRRGFDAKQCWIAFGAKIKGTIVIDSGAAKALMQGGKSLLASGIVDVEGEFSKGDVVAIRCVSSDGDNLVVELGRGIVNYSSSELSKIKGAHSKDIPRLLRWDNDSPAAREAIHTDNMVILKPS